MGGHTGGRSDAGPNRTTASHVTKGQINQAGNKPSRKDLNKSGGIVDFIAGGGVTGMVVRGITNALDTKKNKKSKSGDVYDYNEAKEKIDYKPTKDPRTGNDNNNNSQVTQKSIEQPKVKSQMNNKEVKSGLIVADKIAPTGVEMTGVEMTAEEKLVARKRGKKTRTILSSVTGDNSKATLSKKTLLG